MSDADWFKEAADEVQKTTKAVIAARAATVRLAAAARAAAERERVERERMVSGRTMRTAADFGIAPPGYDHANATLTWTVGERIRPTTPEQAREIILEHVRNSPDPFTAAGEWMTQLTQALSEIAREHMAED